ncbi:cold-shock protein [Gorillibacterium sp. sgz5001074]|uniref:cold-shock protein n=1 Tax=Gorillibacterium sp. sgz5001074 TaxID=3446695 RepID=UPI003F678C14
MYHSRKRPLENVPEEITDIWSCSNENCNGWMRDNFAFRITPTCPQCHAIMSKSQRMLSIVENTSPLQKKQ